MTPRLLCASKMIKSTTRRELFAVKKRLRGQSVNWLSDEGLRLACERRFDGKHSYGMRLRIQPDSRVGGFFGDRELAQTIAGSCARIIKFVGAEKFVRGQGDAVGVIGTIDGFKNQRIEFREDALACLDGIMPMLLDLQQFVEHG
jgi:hypothetical protein